MKHIGMVCGKENCWFNGVFHVNNCNFIRGFSVFIAMGDNWNG